MALCFALTIIGCKDSSDNAVDNAQLVKNKLAGTWNVTYAELDGTPETDAFANLQLGLDANLSYTTNSTTIERQPNPWAEQGSFTLPAEVTSLDNIVLTRDDGLEATFNFIDDNNMRITFIFNDSNTGSNGRVQAVTGNWVFEFTKN